MKITKLHIENFGTIHNYDMDLSSGFSQVFKPNGWGKSTFSVFLKAMFFGMSAKSRGNATNYERTKYLPWQGGNYGGYIEFIYQEHHYRLTRYFGKTPEGDSQEVFDLQTNQVIKLSSQEIGEVIFGVGKETFEITAYFPQLNFMPADNGQIKANLTGANKFQDDLENLGKAIKIIDVKTLSLKKQVYKREQIEDLKRQISQNGAYHIVQKKNLQSLQEEVSLLEEKIEQQDEMLKKEKEKQAGLDEKFAQKRELEKILQENTALINQKLLEKANTPEEVSPLPKSNKKAVFFNLCAITVLVAIFACLTKYSLIGGLVGIALTLVIFSTILLVLRAKNKKKKQAEKEKSTEQEKPNLDSEIEQLQQVIENTQKELLAYEDITFSKGDEMELMAIVSALKIDLASKKLACQNLENDLDRLLEEGDKLNSHLKKIQETNDVVGQKLEILAKTKEFLSQAEQNVSKRFIVPLNEEFKSLLKRFKLEKNDFVVDSSMVIKENTIYGTKEIEFSSQGLQDISAFCQRVNLIKCIYKNEKPFIVLDDTFVNLDDEKLEVAKTIVKEIAKEFQVIYICCNSRCAIEG